MHLSPAFLEVPAPRSEKGMGINTGMHAGRLFCGRWTCQLQVLAASIPLPWEEPVSVMEEQVVAVLVAQHTACPVLLSMDQLKALGSLWDHSQIPKTPVAAGSPVHFIHSTTNFPCVFGRLEPSSST